MVVNKSPHKYRNTYVGMCGRGDLTLTNSVSSKHVQHATLSDGFEGGPSQDAVDSVPQEVAVAQF